MAAPAIPSSSPISAPASLGRNTWRDLDWVLLFLVFTLSIWGCLTINSAARPAEDNFIAGPQVPGAAAGANANRVTGDVGATRSERSNDATKQGIYLLLGAAAIAFFAFADYQFLMHLQFPVYLGNMLMLGLVLVPGIGRMVNGARSWIPLGPFSLQPAEFCKVAVVICLAAYLCRRQDKIRELPTLLWSLVYVGVPLLAVLKQPDFGTALSILAIWFGMLFFGGARLRHIAGVAIVGVLLFTYAWKTDKLKEHQKERLAVFLNTNPTRKEMQAGGFQIKQSEIAIGAGQIGGQGYGHGMQNRAKYVPENTTDFIFTVVAEELGFIGGAALLLLYLGLLLRAASTAITTDNYFGVLIAGGFTALIAFHCIVNLGMTMRVMPITGVPLPFFSYGGSSFIAFSMCVGLVQSISMRRRRGML